MHVVDSGHNVRWVERGHFYVSRETPTSALTPLRNKVKRTFTGSGCLKGLINTVRSALPGRTSVPNYEVKETRQL
ncbi:hypothetical protein GJAV_G00095120 [Gymnothorax javanicus]|nr:hypothetical protein GJAV_G00095120 [Gymnothorax javanicus]